MQIKKSKASAILSFVFLFISFTQFDLFLGADETDNKLRLFTLCLLLASVVFLLVLVEKKLEINKRFLAPFLFFLGLFAVTSFFYGITAIQKWMFFFVVCSSVVVYLSIVANKTDVFLKVIYLLIVFNVIALVSQFLIYHAVSYHIDFHKILLPFSRESVMGAERGFGFTRFNGFQLEPGTYAVTMVHLVSLHYFLSGKLKKLHVIALLTNFLTFSASAIVLTFLTFLAIGYSNIKQFNVKKVAAAISALMLLGVVVLYSGVIDYAQSRFIDRGIDADGSTRIKVYNVMFWLESDVERKILGSGFEFIDCEYCEFVNSNGVAFSLIFYLGMWSLPIFVLLFRTIAKDRFLQGYILVILFSRYTLIDPALWLVLLTIIGGKKAFNEVRIS